MINMCFHHFAVYDPLREGPNSSRGLIRNQWHAVFSKGRGLRAQCIVLLLNFLQGNYEIRLHFMFDD